MENVTKVTEWIGKKVKEKGGNIEREVLLVVPTKAGRSYYTSKEGNCYRAYVFIENGLCLDAPRTKEDLFESGMAFGDFQGALADFPAEELHETIPDFHNTVKRLDALKRAVKEDVCKLADSVKEEIEFALS